MNIQAANDNFIQVAQVKPVGKKFEIGKTYSTRSLCNYDCIFSFKIISRTAKRITFNYHGKLETRGIRVDADGVERCLPFGSYSMAAVISADKMVS